MTAPPQTSTPAGHMARVRKVTAIGMVINLALSGAKLVAGLFGGSHAVIADGVHSLSDCVTDLAILLGVRYWSKPPDDCHPYGHRRIETLITAFIGLALAATAVGLAWRAFTSFSSPSEEPPGAIALVAALVSIVSKEALYRWTRTAGRQMGSSAVVANAWHHRSDALSSIPVAIAVAASMALPSLRFLDGAGAIAVSLFILYAAWRIVGPALGQLADRSAPAKEVEAITGLARGVAGVDDVHEVRTRLWGPGIQVDMHITVKGTLTVQEGHEIATGVQRAVRERGPQVLDVVVHVEPTGDDTDQN